MGLPSFHWDSKSRRWAWRGLGGTLRVTLEDDGGGKLKAWQNFQVASLAQTQALTAAGVASLAQLNVNGNTVSKVGAFTGSIILTNAAGSWAVATISNATGVAVGDMVFASPREGANAYWAGIGGAWVPTTNTVNIHVSGSLPAMGFDVVYIRKA